VYSLVGRASSRLILAAFQINSRCSGDRETAKPRHSRCVVLAIQRSPAKSHGLHYSCCLAFFFLGFVSSSGAGSAGAAGAEPKLPVKSAMTFIVFSRSSLEGAANRDDDKLLCSVAGFWTTNAVEVEATSAVVQARRENFIVDRRLVSETMLRCWCVSLLRFNNENTED